MTIKDTVEKLKLTYQKEALVSLPAMLCALANGVADRAPIILIEGSSGDGKTFLADTIQEVLGWELKKFSAHNYAGFVSEVEESCQVEKLSNTIWFCDESHRMDNKLEDFLLKLTDTNKIEESGGKGEKAWHWFRSRNLVILATNHGFKNQALKRRASAAQAIRTNEIPEFALVEITRTALEKGKRENGVAVPPSKKVWAEIRHYCGKSPGMAATLPLELVRAIATDWADKGPGPITAEYVRSIFRDKMRRARRGIDRDTLAMLRHLGEKGPMLKKYLLAPQGQQKATASGAYDELVSRQWVTTEGGSGLQAITAAGRNWLAEYDAETIAIANEK